VYEINSKIFFQHDFYFGGIILDLDKYIFLWQTFMGGVHLRLEPSCIWVDLVIT